MVTTMTGIARFESRFSQFQIDLPANHGLRRSRGPRGRRDRPAFGGRGAGCGCCDSPESDDVLVMVTPLLLARKKSPSHRLAQFQGFTRISTTVAITLPP